MRESNLEMALTNAGIIIWFVIMIFWRERLFKKYLLEISKDKVNVKKSLQTSFIYDFHCFIVYQQENTQAILNFK